MKIFKLTFTLGSTTLTAYTISSSTEIAEISGTSMVEAVRKKGMGDLKSDIARAIKAYSGTVQVKAREYCSIADYGGICLAPE